MPAPDAKTEYQVVGLFSLNDLPSHCAAMSSSARRDAAVGAERARPVRVHAEVERLVVEQLRRPLDRVDLGDLGGHHEARHLEELLGVTSRYRMTGVGMRRIAQARVGVRRARRRCAGTRRRTGCARGRTRCGRSSCRSSSCRGRRCLLTGPLRVHRIGPRAAAGSPGSPSPRALTDGDQQQLGRIVGRRASRGDARSRRSRRSARRPTRR